MPVRLLALALLLSAVVFPVAVSGQAPPSAPPPAAVPAGDVYERQYEGARAALIERQGRPEAGAALAALVSNEDYLPPGRLTPLLREVARTGQPLVAAQASYQLALTDARMGDLAAADRRFRALGLVDQWTVVGPFEAQGRGGLERAFPPELPGGEPRAGHRFPGKEREVGWRSGANVQRLGALALDGLLRPDSDAVAYALTYLRSDRRRQVVLRVGSPGPVRVWVKGQPVLARNVVREARLDQDAAAVVLDPGDNAVLVKTVITNGAWRLYLRVTDVAGNPLPAVSARPEGTGRLAPAARAAGAAGEARTRADTRHDLGAMLQARAERARGKGASDAWLDYARWLAFSRAPDREAKVIEATLERAVAAGAGAAALLLLGERAIEDDDRQQAFERVAAATADPGMRALALAGLGDIARGRRRSSAAVDLYKQALKQDPGCIPAVLALASEEQLVGLPATALARLDGLPAASKTSYRVRMGRARALEAVGRRAQSEAELRAAFAARRTDIDLGLDLARLARQRGDLDEAIQLHRRAVEQRPELSFLPIELARLLEGKGDRAAAERVLADASARLPDEPALHEELGRLLVRAGQAATGLAQLRRSLELRPQNPTLRRYVARLTSEAAEKDGQRGQGAGDLARAFAEDTAPLARAALADAAAGQRSERAGAVVLLDNQAVRVHRNGLAERFTQRLVQVRTEQAAREQMEMYVRYTPGSQEVEIRRAQIYRRVTPEGRPGNPDGGDIQVLQASGRDDRDLSEPWYGLYYDVRADVVQFEGLRPGDVVDLQYTVSDVSAENAFGGYFGDVEFIAETAPRRRWQYVLLAPPERTLYFNEPRVAGLERQQDKRGDEVMYRFAARDIPRIEAEPGMPGWGEVAPYLHVSTYRSWQEVGRWYWNLIADQLAADDGIRKAALAATKGARTVADKVRGVHRFVLENTRYVALEFGIHGYKPYKVSQVLSRRFGDCKDKAALLLVLLREAGVEAEIVLLRTRRNGRVTSNPASLAVFDHAIAYVPALSLYLDGTAEFSGMAELPAEDQGATALRVNARGAELVETPVLPARDNRADRRWVAALEPDGGARVEEVVTVTGQAAPEWREHYQTPGERQERFGKVWSARYPGAVVDEVAVEGTDDRNQPVVARSVAHLPRLAEAVGERVLRLPVTTREADFVQTYARLSRRKHPYLMGYPWQHDEEVRFRLPEGWHVSSLPDPREARSRFGSFRLEIREQAPAPTGAREVREVVVRSQIEVHQHLVPPGDYPAFRAFLGTLDGALRQTLVLEREP